jgi:nitroreductase
VNYAENEPQTVGALTVPEAIEARHSVRRYKPTPIAAEDLREIVRLAGLAPSAWNLQPWRFVVAESPQLKARLREAARGQAQVSAAPAVIVMYSDMRDALATADETLHPGVPAEQRPTRVAGVRKAFAAKTDAEREAWGASQSHIALGFLLLAAQSLGYATSAMAGFDAEKVKEVLGLPAHVTVPALIAIGIPDEAGYSHHRHPVERIAKFR